jgi:hypothetical protein
MTKEQVKEKEKQLLEITGAFCAKKLNDEYFALCENSSKRWAEKGMSPSQGKNWRYGRQPWSMP